MAPFTVDAKELGHLVETKQKDNLKSFGDIEGLANRLKTSLKKGLAGDDLEDRRQHFGINRLPPQESQTFFELVWEGLQDKTLIMLLISAVISLALGIHEDPASGWIEGAAIIVAVAVVVLVGAGNNYQKEKQFRALNAKKDGKEVKVVRAGVQTEISVYDVLVGDIMVVETGDIIPADGVFVSGHGIKCDESAATGESDSISKPEDDPFFLSGSQVLEGYGNMVVVAVGPNSFNGKTMLSLRVESEDTPLQQKLDGLADEIGKVGLVFAVLTITVLVAKELLLNPDPFTFEKFFSHFVKYLITAITMVVVAVPEGLPLAVTLSLAYSMMKMLRDNNLVRHLAACETMGGATAICSDKTGTLTQNKMTVVQGIIAELEFKQVDALQGANPQALQVLFQSIATNSTAYETQTAKGVEFLGNKTECALLGLIKHLGADYKVIRDGLEVIELVPFSSQRKSMSTVVRLGSDFRCYSKGASEIVLKRCTSSLNSKGEVVDITPENIKKLEQFILTMAQNALRTICLAYRDTSSIPKEGWEQFSTEKLILIGIVGIEDPLRPEVPAAVKACQKAGVVVRMVTGDNIITAKNIAKNCGIFEDNESMIAMEGQEFRNLPEDKLEEILPKLRVLARSSPLDKQILVSKLKDLGEIVAVTGDGTNDAPALKLAHVGFSMGIAGTEVAKEASDIILMDDNFSSIVKALLWGRNVFDSIRKFLQFQLTVNIVAVILAFIGSVTSGNGESPLKPVQLLWVNLIMDTMAALALATEEPSIELLDRQPHGKDKSGLITLTMWKSIIIQAIFQLIVNFGLLYGLPSVSDIEAHSPKHLTLFFNTFVLCQFFNEINSRKINNELNVFQGLFGNATFLLIMGFTLVMQWIIVEFGGEFTSTTPLTSNEWLFCFGIGALSLPVGLLAKFVPVPQTKAPEPAQPKRVSAKAKWKSAITNVQRQNSVMQAFVTSVSKKKSAAKLQATITRVKTQTSVVGFLRRQRTPGKLSKIDLMALEDSDKTQEPQAENWTGLP